MRKRQKLLLVKSAAVLIIKESKRSKNEVCGILVGLRKNSRELIVTHAIIDEDPPESWAGGVVRATFNVYPELSRIVSAHKDIDYIGEWHSHVNGFKTPSTLDHQTMIGILKDPGYGNLEEVLLLIATPNTWLRYPIVPYLYQRPDLCERLVVKVIQDSMADEFKTAY